MCLMGGGALWETGGGYSQARAGWRLPCAEWGAGVGHLSVHARHTGELGGQLESDSSLGY